jgi:Ca-activated chloride channel family protein
MQPERPISVFMIIGLILFFPGLSQAASPSSLIQKGNTAYEEGHFDEALKAYEQAGVDDPESPQISFNKGAAYYRKGDFAKAKAAWEKASLNSKDLSLEAKAAFNLGNMAFTEAKRQQDSDLQKSLDSCTQSIKRYQQVIDLLKNPADAQQADLKKNAAENIEIVRLVMKSILDALQKQQAQQKQGQQAADTIKQLIAKQEELNNRNQSYHEEKEKNGESKQLNDDISRMAKDQHQLKKETQETADKMEDQQGQDAVKNAKKNLQEAKEQQQKAVDKMNGGDLTGAQKNQATALERLNDALESLENQNQQAGRQDQSPHENQKAQASQKQQEPSASEEPKKQQSASIARMPDDAESILNEEKENMKNHQPLASRDYQRIDKDW